MLFAVACEDYGFVIFYVGDDYPAVIASVVPYTVFIEDFIVHFLTTMSRRFRQ